MKIEFLEIFDKFSKIPLMETATADGQWVAEGGRPAVEGGQSVGASGFRR